jgi:hypothetical protein
MVGSRLGLSVKEEALKKKNGHEISQIPFSSP